jgi:hypothetical protein
MLGAAVASLLKAGTNTELGGLQTCTRQQVLQAEMTYPHWPALGQLFMQSWPHAEAIWRAKETKARKARKAERRAKRAAAAAAIGTIEELPAGKPASAGAPAAQPKPAPQTPIGFLFPGQGSQAVGMLKVWATANIAPSTDSFIGRCSP